MNPLVIVLPVLTGVAAWLFSRGSASASAPSDAPPPRELGDGDDDAEGDTLPPPRPPSSPSSPSSPTSPTGPSSPTVPSTPTGPTSSSTPTDPSAPRPSSKKRTAKAAAKALLEYVTAAIDAGRAATLGDKHTGNAVVRDAQSDMGELPVDGIYGPATRARGEVLLGRRFPARPKTTKAADPKPKPKADAKPKPKPSEPIKADPVVVREVPTLRLERGASYRATIVLSGMETLASNDQVAERLQQLVGPWRPLSVTGAEAIRRATGTYAGNTRDVERPGNVTEFERIAALPKPKPALPAPPPAPPEPRPATPQSQPAPRPAPAPAPAPRPAPAKRTPQAAAQSLFDYVSAAIDAGRAKTLGNKTSPNTIVRDAQADMGELVADGIYGPSTRARGRALLGRNFPART